MNKKIIVLSSVISDSASNMVDIQRVIMKYLLLFIIKHFSNCHANILDVN